MPDLDIYECRIEGLANSGRRWNNVLHYQQVGADVQSTLFDIADTLAEEVLAKFIDTMVPSMAQDFFVTSVRCSRIYPALGVSAIAAPATVTGGGTLDEGLPADVAVVATKITSQPGKSGRGRVYFVGLNEGSHQFDELLVTDASAWADGAAQLLIDQLTPAGAETWNPVLFSRKLAALALPANEVAFPIRNVTIDRTLRNMRSRGRDERTPVEGQPTP